ncbi:MAG: SGNH/GDSL hydrolase family protein [Bacteroidota bacterium]
MDCLQLHSYFSHELDLKTVSLSTYIQELGKYLAPVLVKSTDEEQKFWEVFQRLVACADDLLTHGLVEQVPSARVPSDTLEHSPAVVSEKNKWTFPKLNRQSIMGSIMVILAVIIYVSPIQERYVYFILGAILLGIVIYYLLFRPSPTKEEKPSLGPPYRYFPPVSLPSMEIIDVASSALVRPLLSSEESIGSNTAIIDVGRTINATVSHAGTVIVEYLQESTEVAYIMLVDTEQLKGYQANWFIHLAQLMHANGISVDLYYFQGDPRICTPTKDFLSPDEPHAFLELENLNRGERLIILGSGNIFFNQYEQNIYPWVTNFINSWEAVGILSTVPISYWGWKENVLSEHFVYAPATIEGLVAVIQHFDQLIDNRMDRWLLDIQAILLENAGVGYLKTHVSEPLFLWICASAVYPEIYWELTLHLGDVLERELQQAVLTKENLSILSQLPWFRNGKIPDKGRKRLIKELENREGNFLYHIRKALAEILSAATDSPSVVPYYVPPITSQAGYNLRLFQLINELYLTPSKNTDERKELLSQITDLYDQDTLQDDKILLADLTLSQSVPDKVSMTIPEVRVEKNSDSAKRNILLQELATSLMNTYGREATKLLRRYKGIEIPPQEDGNSAPSERKFELNRRVVEEIANVLGIGAEVFRGHVASDEGIIEFLNKRSRKNNGKKYRRRLIKDPDVVKVIVDGDSWFEYPVFVKDLADWLRERKELAVKAISSGGDWLANMYSQREFIGALKSESPHFLLLAGGIGQLLSSGSLARLIKPNEFEKASAVEYIKEAFYDLLLYYQWLFTGLFHELESQYIQVIIHGYDYPLPSDKVGSGITQSLIHIATGNGQWLYKPLEDLEIKDDTLKRFILIEMVDEYNKALREVAEIFPQVHYVDLRGIVSEPRGWFDELHPTSAFFKIMGDKLNGKISELTDLRIKETTQQDKGDELQENVSSRNEDSIPEVSPLEEIAIYLASIISSPKEIERYIRRSKLLDSMYFQGNARHTWRSVLEVVENSVNSGVVRLLKKVQFDPLSRDLDKEIISRIDLFIARYIQYNQQTLDKINTLSEQMNRLREHMDYISEWKEILYQMQLISHANPGFRKMTSSIIAVQGILNEGLDLGEKTNIIFNNFLKDKVRVRDEIYRILNDMETDIRRNLDNVYPI